MLVKINVDDHVFEAVERESQDYIELVGSKEKAEALFIKLVLTTHFLLRLREVLSAGTWGRLHRLRYDDHGVMDFYLAYDDAERGTAGYSFVRDADGKIEAISTPGGTLNPVDVEWTKPEDFDDLAEKEAELRGNKQD